MTKLEALQLDLVWRWTFVWLVMLIAAELIL